MSGDVLGGLRRVAGRLKRRMGSPRTPRLAPGVHPLRLPLRLKDGESWAPSYFFYGRAGASIKLSGHASVLAPGHCPHEPHSHAEEEILMVLDGEADLLLPEGAGAGGDRVRRLVAGRFVYYPAWFPHSLRARGDSPTNYLMFKWVARHRGTGTPMGFCEHGSGAVDCGPGAGNGLRCGLVFEGSTSHLRKLHCHVSAIGPGAGYEPHVDEHDVVIVVMEGQIETLGSRAAPCDVVLCPAGRPHGIRNAGQTTARYVVFEFHGPERPLWRKALDPARARRAAGRLLRAIASRARGGKRA